MKRLPCLLLLCFLISLSAVLFAQKKPVKKPSAKKTAVEKPVEKKSVEKKSIDPVADEKKVRDLLAFLEYMMNTLGSSSTSARDKEVLVTQSYSKIFRDAKVQVEDDLDENRLVVTNKDIVAYLKDVDFFFKDVKFELVIEDVKTSTLSGGELFYKVTVRRTMTGTTTEGNQIRNVVPRYIEVNYSPQDQDLKIVSIYTNLVNEKDALVNWWNALSYEWQSIFKRSLKLTADSLDFNQIKRITSILSLDISNNQYILDLEPLAQLNRLQQLDLSHTSAADLSPLRNLTELVELNLSHTNVQDLTPLRYLLKLETLKVSSTRVLDISVLERMQSLKNLEFDHTNIADAAPVANLTNLEKVSFRHTKISDLSPVQALGQITELNVSGTQVKDIEMLRNLKNMKTIDLDSTKVTQLQVLANFDNLKVIQINYTRVSDLMPLTGLKQLEKVYCDQSLVTREAAEAFMAANPKALVIFDSKDLQVWWGTLSPAWKNILGKAASIGSMPSKEELAKVPLLDSIDLNGNGSITDLDALSKLPKLKSIRANKTGISDLSPLESHREITYLDISETSVVDLTPISHLKKLRILVADKSKIGNIEKLQLPALEKFYADQTEIQDVNAREFLDKNSACLLVYKTVHLNRWWSSLSESWKQVFVNQAGLKKPSREELHRLVEAESIEVKDAPISTVRVFLEFVRLKKLNLSGTSMVSISPLENLRSLQSLRVTNCPLQQIDSIYLFKELEELDVSNTPLEDAYPVWKLKGLKSLNCSGTQIRRLDGMEKLEQLEYLDCSNTNVSKISSLDYLPLKTLKCYNTKVSTRAIENFKATHPDCNVIYYR